MIDQQHPDPEARASWIKMRRLEIAATLAEWKRAYIVDGVQRSLADRATLEAEDAALALEARRIGALAVDAKVARAKTLRKQLLDQLLLVLKERNLHHIIEEAERRTHQTT